MSEPTRGHLAVTEPCPDIADLDPEEWATECPVYTSEQCEGCNQDQTRTRVVPVPAVAVEWIRETVAEMRSWYDHPGADKHYKVGAQSACDTFLAILALDAGENDE